MPRAVNHVAISVTDIGVAKRWYRDVMEMTVLAEPAEVLSSTSEADFQGADVAGDKQHLAKLVTAVFGSKLKKFLICHLSSANGVGIELFQFLDPPAERRKDNFEYWKTGFYHIAVTEPDIEKLANRIESTGGKKRTEVMEISKGSGKKICFCEDPFGNIIEIYSHSYEQFWANT